MAVGAAQRQRTGCSRVPERSLRRKGSCLASGCGGERIWFSARTQAGGKGLRSATGESNNIIDQVWYNVRRRVGVGPALAGRVGEASLESRISLARSLPPACGAIPPTGPWKRVSRVPSFPEAQLGCGPKEAAEFADYKS
mgnify:CR=1 FL=1